MLIFSEDPAVREGLRLAIGRHPAPDVGRVRYIEADTGVAVVRAVEAGGVDLCVLDGEAWPTGGMGISRQLKNEIRDCPPVAVLIARRDDKWLAKWSQADAVIGHPLDAVVVADTVAGLLRGSLGAAGAERV